MIDGEINYVSVKELIVQRKKNAITEKIDIDQKIYESMARISDNEKCPSRNVGDILQLTNWILYIKEQHVT